MTPGSVQGDKSSASRHPAVYLVLLGATLAAGLASRRFAGYLPHFLAKSAGDMLWATAVFFLLGLLFQRWSTSRNAAVALAISFADEFSQAYHAPWLDQIRSTTPGHLVLGSGFSWTDLVWYIPGVLLGVLIERLISGTDAAGARPAVPARNGGGVVA